MRFYDALQLDPSILKKKIHAAAQSQERQKLTAAMAARSFLIVLFAIALIAPVTPVFGAENSPMGVALFCIFLGLRFVDFGYRIKDSLVNLTVVFLLLLFSPCAATAIKPPATASAHCLWQPVSTAATTLSFCVLPTIHGALCSASSSSFCSADSEKCFPLTKAESASLFLTKRFPLKSEKAFPNKCVRERFSLCFNQPLRPLLWRYISSTTMS